MLSNLCYLHNIQSRVRLTKKDFIVYILISAGGDERSTPLSFSSWHYLFLPSFFFFCIWLDTYRFIFPITHSTLFGKILCLEGMGKRRCLGRTSGSPHTCSSQSSFCFQWIKKTNKYHFFTSNQEYFLVDFLIQLTLVLFLCTIWFFIFL